MLSLRTNISSLTAQGNLTKTQSMLDASMAKLSSGYRITSASDDAAGLGVSTNLTAQIRSYNQASRNANDGLSVVQTAEGSLNEVANILGRLRELTMQSSSDGIGTTERGFIQTETDQLLDEVNRIGVTTEYNGAKLFGAAAAFNFQVGIRSTADDGITLDTTAMVVDTTGLGTAVPAGGGTAGPALDTLRTGGASALNVDSATSKTALNIIDASINEVSGFRSDLGSVANRLTSVLSTINSASESESAANSRILDVDVAAETANMSKSNILLQAGVSVLAQANQQPQAVLKLLG
jgi:flagellin